MIYAVPRHLAEQQVLKQGRVMPKHSLTTAWAAEQSLQLLAGAMLFKTNMTRHTKLLMFPLKGSFI